jgi:hypothetical protein
MEHSATKKSRRYHKDRIKRHEHERMTLMFILNIFKYDVVS